MTAVLLYLYLYYCCFIMLLQIILTQERKKTTFKQLSFKHEQWLKIFCVSEYFLTKYKLWYVSRLIKLSTKISFKFVGKYYQDMLAQSLTKVIQGFIYLFAFGEGYKNSARLCGFLMKDSQLYWQSLIYRQISVDSFRKAASMNETLVENRKTTINEFQEENIGYHKQVF